MEDYRVVLKDICTVAEAVAKGDLSKTLTVTAEGEIDDAKRTVNNIDWQIVSLFHGGFAGGKGSR